MPKKYNRWAIVNDADIYTVVDFIGMETKKMGRHTSILCPCHNDQHYGSCFLKKDGFECYSCGAKGSIFDLVKEYCNVNLPEAMGIVADSCGGRKKYMYSADEIAQNTYKESLLVKVLDDDKLRLIGLVTPSESPGISVTVESYDCETEECRPLRPKERIEWYPNEKSGMNVIVKNIDRNPLKTLANEDYEAYSALICDKCHESINKYQDMILFVQGRKDGEVVGKYCRQLSSETGIGTFIKVCQSKIREIENILIEFNKTPEKRKNMFGKIRTGAAF